jgi:hypothetical protein
MTDVRKIKVGSNSDLKKEKFNRDSHSKCVIHLIDPMEEIEDAEEMSTYITDQMPNLWNSLRHGDLIENVDRISNRFYGVMRKKQTESEYMVKSGLEIIDADEEDFGLIPSNFYAITKFPLGYHNHMNMMTNNTYAPHYSESQIERDDYFVPLDLKKLHLSDQDLTDDVIFEKVIGFGRGRYRLSYVVLTFRKLNYMIGTRGDESDFRDRIRVQYLDAKWGADAVDSLSWKKKIFELLQSEDVKIDNLLLI